MLYSMKTSTIYRKSIKSVEGRSILKKGSANKKLGYRITAKKWRGSRLYSLTLTERETCPQSCHHWDDCYGNNMPFAHRFSTDGLMPKLTEEIATLCKKHPNGVVLRLHVLGDFYSLAYVLFWQLMLNRHDNLRVYGYTGREPDSRIGAAIASMNRRYPDRFVVRYSRSHDSANGMLYAAEESFTGSSFVCPEQTNKVKDCASCGLCWSAQKTVRFLSH